MPRDLLLSHFIHLLQPSPREGEGSLSDVVWVSVAGCTCTGWDRYDSNDDHKDDADVERPSYFECGANAPLQFWPAKATTTLMSLLP